VAILAPPFLKVEKKILTNGLTSFFLHLHNYLPTIYYCYIVENGNRLAGVLSLRDLIIAPPNERIDNIMSRHLIAVQPLASQEETAHLISRYNLLAIPVIGEERKLLGIVTVDDAIDAVLPTRWKKRLPKVFSA